jgi:hypothetical protein
MKDPRVSSRGYAVWDCWGRGGVGVHEVKPDCGSESCSPFAIVCRRLGSNRGRLGYDDAMGGASVSNSQEAVEVCDAVRSGSG